MTKQLGAGRSRAHAFRRCDRKRRESPVDPSFAGMAFNLIVADFNSYFVGKHGILVHDNTPRAATAALLPGLGPRETAP